MWGSSTSSASSQIEATASVIATTATPASCVWATSSGSNRRRHGKRFGSGEGAPRPPAGRLRFLVAQTGAARRKENACDPCGRGEDAGRRRASSRAGQDNGGGGRTDQRGG